MLFNFLGAAAKYETRVILRTLLAVAVSFFYLVPAISDEADEADAGPKYAGIVIDANNGKVVYSRNADARRYPASLTKIMTLYILFEELNAGRMSKATRLKVSAHAAAQAPSKLGLKPGETISVEDAIKALVTKSANDVAVIVAEAIGGTERGFARRMTDTARRIGMKRTTFRNASGLPNPGQVTTARDMATLGLRVQRDFPKWYSYFAIRSFTYRGKTYRTHNRLLGRFAGTDGVKTGYTRASGFNLTSSVRRDGKHLVGVVLGGRTGASRDRQMRTILANALPKAIARRNEPDRRIADVPIPVPNPNLVSTLTDDDKAVPAKPPLKPTVIAKADVDMLGSLAAGTAEEEGEGDAEPETAEALTVSAERTSADAVVNDGTWSIQVGAFNTQADAQRRLDEAIKAGVDSLAGKKGITLTHSKDDTVIYRARFAGFDRASAQRACAALSRKSINCYALAP
jgi:D-alanyl-D-alanine carboxypeptidase